MPGTVLILGANGKIGAHCETAFASAGWTVRRYERGTDMTAAAQGADVIVNGLNPPNYNNWAKLIPRITAQVIAAAKASGATVIIPGNVYNFGDTPGTWDETTPQRPSSRKGKIRMDMEAAYRASSVPTIILRAGNFIDPDRNGCLMSMIHLKDITKGRVTHMGDPDVETAFCYLPDWATAAVMLAEKRAELAPFEDVPFPGHAFAIRDLRDHLEAALGRRLKLAGFPWIVMTLTAPFWELARELTEMRYLWRTTHRLGADKITRLLPGFRPTPLARVMEAALPADIRPDQPMRTGRTTSVSGQKV